MGKQRLFVLPFPLALEAATLGRLIKNPENPHQDFLDLDLLPPNLKPRHVTSNFDGFINIAKSSRSADLEFVLTKFASVFFESGEKSLERLMACKATEYVVLNSGNWYDTLCGEPTARLWLEKAFIAGSQSVYLITGYRTLEEARLHQQRDNDMGAGGNVTLPTGQIAGVPSDAPDVGVRGGHQVVESAGRAFTVPGEKIFAVQYRQIKFKWYARKDVDASFLEPNNRWVEMFTMRSGSSDLDGDYVYEATLADDEDQEALEGCEISESCEGTYYFKKQNAS
jgi:hypothetical protein